MAGMAAGRERLRAVFVPGRLEAIVGRHKNAAASQNYAPSRNWYCIAGISPAPRRDSK